MSAALEVWAIIIGWLVFAFLFVALLKAASDGAMHNDEYDYHRGIFRHAYNFGSRAQTWANNRQDKLMRRAADRHRGSNK